MTLDARSLRYDIEDAWLSRAKAQDYGKSSTVTYKRKEAEFFMGAAAALNAVQPAAEKGVLGPLVPPAWIINLMSGRNVVEPERIRYTGK